jgi:hypothetical protein
MIYLINIIKNMIHEFWKKKRIKIKNYKFRRLKLKKNKKLEWSKLKLNIFKSTNNIFNIF